MPEPDSMNPYPKHCLSRPQLDTIKIFNDYLRLRRRLFIFSMMLGHCVIAWDPPGPSGQTAHHPHPPLQWGGNGKDSIAFYCQLVRVLDHISSVLRIRDVYPGSRSATLNWLFSPNKFNKLSEIWYGMFIPDLDFFPITDPGSGSVTLYCRRRGKSLF